MKAHKIIVWLLILIGFGGCCNRGAKGKASKNDKLEEIVVTLYGIPFASFSVKGNVTDDADRPIEGIQVVSRVIYVNNSFVADTVYTAADGSFITPRMDNEIDVLKFAVTAKDVDGNENGRFLANEEIFDAYSDGWADENGTIVRTVDFRLEEDE